MPVVDFSQPKGGCDVTLHGAAFKPDPAADAIVYKVDLSMTLASRSEAEQLEETLPGLAEVYDRAGESDNWKSTLAVKPADSLRVVLVAKEAGQDRRQGAVAPGGVIVQGTAELLEVKSSQSKRARVVLVRLVFRGQGANVAERLADNLSRSVGMSFERTSTQGVLPFASASKAPTLRPGMIVAATLPSGEQVVGRLVEIDGDELSLSEAGTEITVEAASVITSFAFSPDGDTQAALQDYADRCERRELPVSWRALVEVMAKRSGLEDGASPTTGASVSADDVEAAVAYAEALAGRALDVEGAGPEQAEAAPEQVAEVVEPGVDKPKRQPRARARA